jgi:hypothetical protein
MRAGCERMMEESAPLHQEVLDAEAEVERLREARAEVRRMLGVGRLRPMAVYRRSDVMHHIDLALTDPHPERGEVDGQPG